MAKKKIINSDQGSQYTTQTWVNLLESNGIKVGMDERGRCKNNILIKRFWRTIKQECIYRNLAKTVEELRLGISNYIRFFNYQRTHQSIDALLLAMKYGIAYRKSYHVGYFLYLCTNREYQGQVK